jgi:hypothetical protein
MVDAGLDHRLEQGLAARHHPCLSCVDRLKP